MLSKKQVKKAGEILAKNPKDVEAMEVLSKWRSLHTHPINAFQSLLRKRRLKNATIAQRLKRTPSIIRKIQRFDGMNLARMQDIGGIRVILPNIQEVYKLHNSLTSGGRHGHKPLLPPKDYIANPKDDGYRSLHQVFRYNNDDPELKGLQIELQIRTRVQHYWATAVETLGVIEKSSFKTGEGSEDYKRFFKLASVLFCHYEKSVILPEFQDTPIERVVSEFSSLEQKLQAFNKLRGLIVTGEHITSVKTKDEVYYLMQLDANEKSVSLTPFEKNQLDMAERVYRLLEMQNVDNPHIELVLISVKNFKDIKKAYPNYFLDTQTFIESLEKICQKYKN